MEWAPWEVWRDSLWESECPGKRHHPHTAIHPAQEWLRSLSFLVEDFYFPARQQQQPPAKKESLHSYKLSPFGPAEQPSGGSRLESFTAWADDHVMEALERKPNRYLISANSFWILMTLLMECKEVSVYSWIHSTEIHTSWRMRTGPLTTSSNSLLSLSLTRPWPRPSLHSSRCSHYLTFCLATNGSDWALGHFETSIFIFNFSLLQKKDMYCRSQKKSLKIRFLFDFIQVQFAHENRLVGAPWRKQRPKPVDLIHTSLVPRQLVCDPSSACIPNHDTPVSGSACHEIWVGWPTRSNQVLFISMERTLQSL